MDITSTMAILLLSLFSSSSAQAETTTHLRFYFHENVTSSDPTAVVIAEAPSTSQSKTDFGALTIMDDPITVGPDMSSGIIGHTEGLYGSASKEGWHLVMAMTFAFEEGEYNGSTVAVLGRNSAMDTGIREMPVVGGTGMFRMARGYAQAKTYSLNTTTGNSVVEYNLYFTHQ